MRGPRRNLLACVFVLSAAVIAGAADSSLARVELSLSVDNANPRLGEDCTVAVHASGAPPFGAWQVHLAFDPARVEVTGQRGGTFPYFIFIPDRDPTDGKIIVGAADLCDNAGGDGVLAIFTFRALARGVTAITTENYSDTNRFGNVLVDLSLDYFLPDIVIGELDVAVGTPPLASAGSDQTVQEHDTVVLDATGSFSPDDGVGIAGYLWEQISGPAVKLCDADTAVATFVVPDDAAPGDIVFCLTVTDDDGLVGTETVAVTVEAKAKSVVLPRFAPAIWFFLRAGLNSTLDRAYEQVVSVVKWTWPGGAFGRGRKARRLRLRGRGLRPPKGARARVELEELTITAHH